MPPIILDSKELLYRMIASAMVDANPLSPYISFTGTDVASNIPRIIKQFVKSGFRFATHLPDIHPYSVDMMYIAALAQDDLKSRIDSEETIKAHIKRSGYAETETGIPDYVKASPKWGDPVTGIANIIIDTEKGASSAPFALAALP